VRNEYILTHELILEAYGYTYLTPKFAIFMWVKIHPGKIYIMGSE
jgi:hypothetical protein